jgi:two-component sensor histidine kinase
MASDPTHPRHVPGTWNYAVAAHSPLGSALPWGLAAVVGLGIWRIAGLPVPSGAPDLAPLLLTATGGTALVLTYHLRGARRRQVGATAEAERLALLFVELQHRMSNNLAAAGSLLAMQGRQIDDPQARRLLGQAAARIATASRLGRRLHDPSGQSLDFGAFLRDAAPEVAALNGAEGTMIRVEADEVILPGPQALPLALIAVELLSNALEHGAPQEAPWRVEVALERLGPDQARLVVRHDGSLPPGFDLAQVRSLGLVVARQLAAQAEAELTIEEGEGVVSMLTFPLKDSSASVAVAAAPARHPESSSFAARRGHPEVAPSLPAPRPWIPGGPPAPMAHPTSTGKF